MSQQLVRLDKQTEGIRKIVDILRMVARTKKYTQEFCGGWGNLQNNTLCAVAAFAFEIGHSTIWLDNVRSITVDTEALSKDLGTSYQLLHNIIHYNDDLHMTYSQIADRLEYEYLK